MSSLRFNDLKKTKFVDKTRNLETLLKITWPLRSSIMGWSGFMQSVQGGKFPGQSSIGFLPMIDMNPNDMTCIYSTLSFICSTARRHLITSTVTFDQPLYWKVLTIISNEPIDSPLRSLALRLGGCHLEMSFLGCIGHIMQSSGLYEVLETVYATNAVEHMLAGKAVARVYIGSTHV